MATVVLFFWAQAVQPSTNPRAPAELIILIVRSGGAEAAETSAANASVRKRRDAVDDRSGSADGARERKAAHLTP